MSTTSVITSRDRDCVACRLVSGSGLLSIGLYVGYQTKNVNQISGKLIMTAVGSGFVILGATRLFDLPPFKGKYSH